MLAIDGIRIDEFRSFEELMNHVKGKNELRLVVMAENVCKKIKHQQQLEIIKKKLKEKHLELENILKQEELIFKKYGIDRSFVFNKPDPNFIAKSSHNLVESEQGKQASQYSQLTPITTKTITTEEQQFNLKNNEYKNSTGSSKSNNYSGNNETNTNSTIINPILVNDKTIDINQHANETFMSPNGNNNMTSFIKNSSLMSSGNSGISSISEPSSTASSISSSNKKLITNSTPVENNSSCQTNSSSNNKLNSTIPFISPSNEFDPIESDKPKFRLAINNSSNEMQQSEEITKSAIVKLIKHDTNNNNISNNINKMATALPSKLNQTQIVSTKPKTFVQKYISNRIARSSSSSSMDINVSNSLKEKNKPSDQFVTTPCTIPSTFLVSSPLKKSNSSNVPISGILLDNYDNLNDKNLDRPFFYSNKNIQINIDNNNLSNSTIPNRNEYKNDNAKIEKASLINNSQNHTKKKSIFNKFGGSDNYSSKTSLNNSIVNNSTVKIKDNKKGFFTILSNRPKFLNENKSKINSTQSSSELTPKKANSSNSLLNANKFKISDDVGHNTINNPNKINTSLSNLSADNQVMLDLGKINYNSASIIDFVSIPIASSTSASSLQATQDLIDDETKIDRSKIVRASFSGNYYNPPKQIKNGDASSACGAIYSNYFNRSASYTPNSAFNYLNNNGAKFKRLKDSHTQQSKNFDEFYQIPVIDYSNKDYVITRL